MPDWRIVGQNEILAVAEAALKRNLPGLPQRRSHSPVTNSRDRQLHRADMYGEYTPSGAGFRFYGCSAVPVPTGKQKEYGKRNPKTDKEPGIEMYSSGRFFTFTGRQIPGTPSTVKDCTEQLLEIHTRVFGNQTKSEPPPNHIEELALDLIEGRNPDKSRNDLMFNLSGLLVRAGWPQTDIIKLHECLIASFNKSDPGYDIDKNVEHQKATLKSIIERHKQGEAIPSIESFIGRVWAIRGVGKVAAALTSTSAHTDPGARSDPNRT
jgi:hypothetical protein